MKDSRKFRIDKLGNLLSFFFLKQSVLEVWLKTNVSTNSLPLKTNNG